MVEPGEVLCPVRSLNEVSGDDVLRDGPHRRSTGASRGQHLARCARSAIQPKLTGRDELEVEEVEVAPRLTEVDVIVRPVAVERQVGVRPVGDCATDRDDLQLGISEDGGREGDDDVTRRVRDDAAERRDHGRADTGHEEPVSGIRRCGRCAGVRIPLTLILTEVRRRAWVQNFGRVAGSVDVPGVGRLVGGDVGRRVVDEAVGVSGASSEGLRFGRCRRAARGRSERSVPSEEPIVRGRGAELDDVAASVYVEQVGDRIGCGVGAGVGEDRVDQTSAGGVRLHLSEGRRTGRGGGDGRVVSERRAANVLEPVIVAGAVLEHDLAGRNPREGAIGDVDRRVRHASVGLVHAVGELKTGRVDEAVDGELASDPELAARGVVEDQIVRRDRDRPVAGDRPVPVVDRREV